MDDSQLWRLESMSAADIYGRGVPPGGPWALAVFGKPITPESLRRVIPDPLTDED